MKAALANHKRMLVQLLCLSPHQAQIKAAFKRLRDNPDANQRIWFTEYPSTELQPLVDSLYALTDSQSGKH
jgi:hypothetical protein